MWRRPRGGGDRVEGGKGEEWGTSVLEGTSEEKKNRIFWYISKLLLFPCTCPKFEWIFLGYFLWGPSRTLGAKLTNVCEGPSMSGSLWVLTQSCPHGISGNLLSAFRFSYTGNGPQRFLLMDFSSRKLWFSTTTSLPLSFWGNSWPCNLPFLMDLRRVTDFQLVQSDGF